MAGPGKFRDGPPFSNPGYTAPDGPEFAVPLDPDSGGYPANSRKHGHSHGGADALPCAAHCCGANVRQCAVGRLTRLDTDCWGPLRPVFQGRYPERAPPAGIRRPRRTPIPRYMEALGVRTW